MHTCTELWADLCCHRSAPSTKCSLKVVGWCTMAGLPWFTNHTCRSSFWSRDRRLFAFVDRLCLTPAMRFNNAPIRCAQARSLGVSEEIATQLRVRAAHGAPL